MPELNPIVPFLFYVAIAAFAALLTLSAEDEKPKELVTVEEEEEADGNPRN